MLHISFFHKRVKNTILIIVEQKKKFKLIISSFLLWASPHDQIWFGMPV